MTHTNPFLFGRVVRGKNFCNRIPEMQQLRDTAITKNNLILISPRRYGKTSLVLNALEKYNLPFLFIDCFDIIDEKTLLQKVLTAYCEALQKGDVIDKLKLFSHSLDIDYSFTTHGLRVHIRRHQDSSLQTILAQAAKKFILVFDEFQELFVVDPQLTKKLRSILQLLNQSCIFLGSKKHLLLYLFSDQKSPFYHFGSVLHLDKIPESEWTTFIAAKFKQTNTKISLEEITQLIQYAELIPFYVQYLCYYYWEKKKQSSSLSVPEFIESLTNSNSYVYEEIYTKLPLLQQKALRIVASNETKLFTQDIIDKFSLTSTQSLNKALTSLTEKGILEKNGVYRFNDPLFKLYVQNLI